MALTQIIRQECKECGKIALEVSRSKLGKSTIIKLACGHSTFFSSLESTQSAYDSIVFNCEPSCSICHGKGCKPRPYQIDCIRFAENSGIRCIIADEQGLGKTIETLSLLRLHPEKLLPCVIVVPTTVKLQWLREIHRICCNSSRARDPRFLTQVIHSGKEQAMPGFQIYIVTYDILKKDDLFEYLPSGTIKTLIIDECQRVKNHLSNRAKAVQRIGRDVPHIIPMSGTPIKNNSGEYFTVLNLVDSKRFAHYTNFINTYCDSFNNGWALKVGGLKDPEKFHEDTKDIIIRRVKSDVLKDLPPIDRKFYHVELDKKLNKVYAQALKELEEELYNGEGSKFEQGATVIAIMSRLRHITGLSKVTECVEFTTEFLLSCERKIVIFCHHQDVAQLVENNLNVYLKDGGFEPVCMMHSGLDGNRRAELIEQFKSPTRRVMVASTLAAGEGLNLQFCSDAVLLERQWNPANENQAEGRFHRFGQQNNVSITYMIASGTIDDYFTELVEIKRSIVEATLDNKQTAWDQSSLMTELAQILVSKGRDKWRL